MRTVPKLNSFPKRRDRSSGILIKYFFLFQDNILWHSLAAQHNFNQEKGRKTKSKIHKTVGFRYIYLIFLALGFCAMDVSAQMEYSTTSKKAIKYYKQALRFYDVKRSSEAIELLKKAIKADDNFVEAHTISGDYYADLNDYENAIIEYQKVVNINPDYFRYAYKQLADSYYLSGKYADAIPNYQLFLTKERISPKIIEAAQRSLANAKFGAEAVKNPVPFIPTNLGESVNSDQYEYFPVLTADEKTLVFTRNQRRVGAMDYQEDFYVSSSNGTDWTTARNIGEPINTDDNEGAQTITADGSQLFFIGCNRRDGKGSCDIYHSQREGKRWGKPKNLGLPVNTSKWESQPSISADGKTLYFVSNRKGGLGGSDIYITHLAPNGEWTIPRNLGEVINTKFAEETPFIHPDGKTLYFTSNGHIGMGQKDIYITQKNANGSWSEPKNLGYPINTWKDEMGLFVAASGETAYFSSDRKEGYGKLDLYSFPLYEDARPNKVTYVKGKVRDKVFGKPLGARFQLINLATSEVVAESTSDKITGKFLVTLPAGHEYALNVSKNGFLFYSEHFSLSENEEVTEPYQLDVALQPIKFGEKVVLKNVFFNTASYNLLPASRVELDKLVEFLTNNSTIEIEIGGHTDNVGSPENNQLLSENRARSVQQYLIKNNIPKERTQYKGYGETEPINSNNTPQGRAENRRTEFKVLQTK